MVCILCGIACKANNKAGICRIAAEQIVHLTLAPCGVVSGGILGCNQCTHLHCCIQSCTAPLIHEEVAVGVGALTAEVAVYLAPVIGDMCINTCCTQTNILPAVNPAEVLLLLGSTVALVGTLIGCKVQPACCPCLFIGAAGGLVETVRAVSCHLIVLCGELVECLCILQVLCIAEVDVVQSQCCCIFCGNVTCTAGCPELSAVVALLLRRTPVSVVLVTVALLVAEALYIAAAVELGGCHEEFTEMIGDELQVLCLTGLVIGILEFIVAPSQCGCGIALRQTEHCVVACVMETAVSIVARVTVASPVQSVLFTYLRTAHICVVEIQRVLQKSCIVVRIRCGCCNRSLLYCGKILQLGHRCGYCGYCKRHTCQCCCDLARFPFQHG